MPTINVTVRNKIAKSQPPAFIVCGNSDYTAVFDLDDEWAWKKIHVTNGNTADISIDRIDMPEARRLFKINMRKTNQTGQPYYLNVYEIEMYESDY